MAEKQPHYTAMIKIAEGNHTAAIFFSGWLSMLATDDQLCRMLDGWKRINGEEYPGQPVQDPPPGIDLPGWGGN